MTSIRTSDVVGQLRRSYEAEAKALAGSNTLISKTEAAKVKSAELRGAIASITDGQPGARLNVDLVVDEAMKRALQRLSGINSAGTAFLSKAEIEALKKKQPDLGNRIAAAYDAVKAGVPATPAPVLEAVKKALTPWAGGTLPPMDVRLVKETSTTRIVEVDIRRNDGPTVTAKVTLGKAANEIQSVSMFTDTHPVTGPVVASLQAALPAGAKVLGYVERVDASSGKAEFLTAWSAAGQSRLSLVDPQAKTNKPTSLASTDELSARSLALMMAKLKAFELVSNSGGPDDARFEYHLRTAALKPANLSKVTEPDDSAVGFTPATDAFQFQLSRVWGDIAVFVTFAKNGTLRLEDFN
jgi:hypothetical protein